MNRRVIGAILLTVLAIGALGAIGFGVFQAGYQFGLENQVGAEVVRVQPGPGAWHGWYGPGYYGGFGLIFKFFFLFLLFALIGKLFFRGPWGGRQWGHERHHYWEDRMSEWHRQAHVEETDKE